MGPRWTSGGPLVAGKPTKPPVAQEKSFRLIQTEALSVSLLARGLLAGGGHIIAAFAGSKATLLRFHGITRILRSL